MTNKERKLKKKYPSRALRMEQKLSIPTDKEDLWVIRFKKREHTEEERKGTAIASNYLTQLIQQKFRIKGTLLQIISDDGKFVAWGMGARRLQEGEEMPSMIAKIPIQKLKPGKRIRRRVNRRKKQAMREAMMREAMMKEQNGSGAEVDAGEN